MAPKEPTRAQLSSRLSYSQHTPSFIRRLQNKVAGRGGYDEDEYEEGEPEFEDYDHGSGRPPIPRRPAIPERPPEDPGSADEDGDDEKPQVIVLKEGKHLTEREAENIRRKVKGLPPLPDTSKDTLQPGDETASNLKESQSSSEVKPSKRPTLSFSTSKKPVVTKRKLEAIGQLSDNEDGASSNQSSKKSKPPPKGKKQKKNKTLLSFGDDT